MEQQRPETLENIHTVCNIGSISGQIGTRSIYRLCECESLCSSRPTTPGDGHG
jgi:hypothetical protein